MSDASVNNWLRKELSRNTALLTKLRDKLEKSLERQPDEPDADGRPRWTQPDLNENGTPSRDWCRAFARYQTGLATLMQEQREQTKIQLLAKRAGLGELSDEDYAREMVELGREAVRELSERDLVAELARRGLVLPEPLPADDDGRA